MVVSLRIFDLPSYVPVTFFYGSKSCIDSAAGLEVQMQRPEGYVDVQVSVLLVFYQHLMGSNLLLKMSLFCSLADKKPVNLLVPLPLGF